MSTRSFLIRVIGNRAVGVSIGKSFFRHQARKRSLHRQIEHDWFKAMLAAAEARLE